MLKLAFLIYQNVSVFKIGIVIPLSAGPDVNKSGMRYGYAVTVPHRLLVDAPLNLKN